MIIKNRLTLCEAAFEINPYFKGDAKGDKPSIEKLVFRYIPSDKVAEEVKAGKVDLMNRVTTKESIEALKKESGWSSTAYPRSGLSFISFNCEQPGVKDAAVRQAIAYCFDRSSFAEAITGEYGQVPNGFSGKGQWMVMLLNGETEAPENMETAKKYQLGRLKLSQIRDYEFNTDRAERVLDQNGWRRDTDGIRHKSIGGQDVKLELVLAYSEGSAAADVFPATLVENLKKVGISLTLKEMEPDALLRQYYRQDDRDCDMFYLATNFNTVYDPAESFALDDEHQVLYNRTALKDQILYNQAVRMRKTVPGDLTEYCARWITFQNRLMEKVPMIPAYTNDYYDFYIPALKNYNITSYQTWSKAIVSATME